MKRKFHIRWTGCLVVLAVFVVAFVGLYLAVTAFPSIGANGADWLRNIIGDKATAQLEMLMFSVQDTVHQVEYNLGLARAVAPWAVASATPLDLPPTPSTSPVPHTATPIPPKASTPDLTHTPTLVPPTLTPTATPWQPGAITASGPLQGEGTWDPYIQGSDGRTVAYRTFLQPDPKRPYSLVSVVAFDLSRTRLGFVLGISEPKVQGQVFEPRSGAIPSADFKPGVLLATFNGGFKGEHGAYGAMAHGLVALPPQSDLATVALYQNGQLKIGVWGKDILATDKLVFYRQNCRLVIQDGKINPLVNVDSPVYWGANLNGATVTWRSGIGISPDGNTLYYIAGPSMTASVLAQVMLSVGIQSGMQLDINNYWVHFTAVRTDGDNMIADPLYPDVMKFDVDRYLKPYSRDFFYIAAKTP